MRKQLLVLRDVEKGAEKESAALHTFKLALIAGALWVGIGFGLQSVFSYFISGLILLFEQAAL